MHTNRNEKTTLLFPLISLLVLGVFANLFLFSVQAGSAGENIYLLSGAAVAAAILLLVAVTFVSLRNFRRQEPERQPSKRKKDCGRDKGFDAQYCWDQTFNMISDPVSIHDRDFRIIKVNRAVCDFFNKTREEMIGQPCYRIFHDTEKPVDECPHRKSIESGQPFGAEIHPPGADRALHITCSPLFDETGKITGTVHLTRPAGTFILPDHTGKNTKLVAICASCKNIRDDEATWMKVEEYLPSQYGAVCTHSICPECQKKLYPLFSR